MGTGKIGHDDSKKSKKGKGKRRGGKGKKGASRAVALIRAAQRLSSTMMVMTSLYEGFYKHLFEASMRASTNR